MAARLIMKLCRKANKKSYALYEKVEHGIIYKIVAVSENEARKINHPYHGIYIPRAFPTESSQCFVISLERYTTSHELLHYTALYIFYDESSSANKSVLYYGSNMIGEDCYWDEELMKKVTSIIYRAKPRMLTIFQSETSSNCIAD